MPHSDSLGRHVCWAFDQPAEFRRLAADYLRAGMAAGNRVMYIAHGDPKLLLDEISVVDGFRTALSRGAAEVISVDSAYHEFSSIDPAQQLRYYAAATQRAVADGYTGLRVAANATSQVLTPANLDAFVRYEHLVERYMVRHPFSALCAYDRAVLTEEQVAQLACMHPQTSPGATSLRLYASGDPQVRAVLAGEVDLACHQLFETALERADLQPESGPITIDATALEFIDHRGLYLLSTFLSHRCATAVLRCRHDSPLAMLTSLLRPPRLQLEMS